VKKEEMFDPRYEALNRILGAMGMDDIKKKIPQLKKMEDAPKGGTVIMVSGNVSADGEKLKKRLEGLIK